MKGSGWRFKNCEIMYIFNHGASTKRDIVKRMVRLDSAHQIGLEIIFSGFLSEMAIYSWAEYFKLDWPSPKLDLNLCNGK